MKDIPTLMISGHASLSDAVSVPSSSERAIFEKPLRSTGEHVLGSLREVLAARKADSVGTSTSAMVRS